MTQLIGGSQTCFKDWAASGGMCMFSGAGWCLHKERGLELGSMRTCCGELRDLDLKVASSIPIEESRGGPVLPGRQASRPSMCMSLIQAPSHFLLLVSSVMLTA